MKTLTDEQKTDIENIESFIKEKAELLKEYKSYAENIEYADDEFEEDLIMQKREEIAIQIKNLGIKIREIEALKA